MFSVSRPGGTYLDRRGATPAIARIPKTLAKEKEDMALPFDETHGDRDPRALAILAKTIYRELRASGYAERDVMTLASELLGMVATEVKGRRVTPTDS